MFLGGLSWWNKCNFQLSCVYSKRRQREGIYFFSTVAALSKFLIHLWGRRLGLFLFYISWDLVEVWQVDPLCTGRGQQCSCTRQICIAPFQLSKWFLGMSWTLLKHLHLLGKGWLHWWLRKTGVTKLKSLSLPRDVLIQSNISFHHIHTSHLPAHSSTHSAPHSPWISCPFFLSLSSGMFFSPSQIKGSMPSSRD